MKNKYILIILSLFFLGCAVKIKDFENYSSVEVGRASLAPTREQIKTNQIKIVLYKIEDKKTKNKNFAISNLSVSMIRKSLLKTNVNIIDRSAIEKFSDEAILADTETGKETEFSAAQYAINGQVDNYNIYSSYKAAYYVHIRGYTQKNFDGSTTYIPRKTIYHPATCSYQGEFNGRFEIYKLPSLKLVMDIALRGDDVIKVEAINRKYNDKNIANSVIKKAVESSLSKKEEKKLLNQFAAKGYVNDVRKNKNKYIIQITLGNKNGVNQNNTLNIYRQSNRVDVLTGRNKIENTKIAEAKTSQLIEADRAWLVVKDKKEAEKILVGDLVKVIY